MVDRTAKVDYMKLHIFLPFGNTFTFKDVDLVEENEQVLTFRYTAQSDKMVKHAKFYLKNIAGWTGVLASLLLFFTSCGYTYLPTTSTSTMAEQIAAMKAQGGTGCIYARVTGAYPPFGNGTLMSVQTFDSANDVGTTPAAKRLTFKDCIEAIPTEMRSLFKGID